MKKVIKHLPIQLGDGLLLDMLKILKILILVLEYLNFILLR